MKGWGYGCGSDCCQHILQHVAECPFLSCLVLVLVAIMLLRILLMLMGCACSMSKTFLGGYRSLSRHGEWAIVTGGSDGIGKAMAAQLVKSGIQKILLVARNEQNLKNAETELQLAGPPSLEVRRLVVDFAKESSEEVFSKVSKAVAGLDIGILVNNVGVSYPHAMYYEDVEIQLIDELVNVNVRSFLLVTRAILPGMKARRRGLIVCVGSGASVIPSDPLYAAYAATKASAEAFCRSLQVETASSGVQVQCHVPLLVTTKLSKCKTPNLLTPNERGYAVAALKSIQNSSMCSSPTVSPYWVHALVTRLALGMPRALWNKIRMGQCLAIRKKALKKESMKKDS